MTGPRDWTALIVRAIPLIPLGAAIAFIVVMVLR